MDGPTPRGNEVAGNAQMRLYEAILHSSPDLMYVFDLQHRFIYANQALLTMWGMDAEQAMGKTCLELGYEPWHAAMHDEEIERVVATRAPIRGDVPFQHATLGTRIYDYIFVPVIGPDGKVEAVAGTTRDVTDRKRQEEALRHSEERFRAMLNASSDLIYRITPDWREVEIVGGRAVSKLPRGQAMGWSTEQIHPEDRSQVLDAIQRARATRKPYEAQHRVQLDGSDWSWISSHAVPVQDTDGQVLEWFGAATDVTERVNHEQHLHLLINELNHRVKNTLAIVQSMVLQTLRTCPEEGLAAELIESRLQALARTHDMLTRSLWMGATLEEIVHMAVGHCIEIDPSRFDVQGPQVMLEPKRAVALSMALHELCTNAIKYGALSVPGGRVRMHWMRSDGDQPRLLIDWEETGGPPVAPEPGRRGFGTRLLQRGLKHDLGGDVALEFAPTGARCHIETPLPAEVA